MVQCGPSCTATLSPGVSWEEPSILAPSPLCDWALVGPGEGCGEWWGSRGLSPGWGRGLGKAAVISCISIMAWSERTPGGAGQQPTPPVCVLALSPS